MNTCLIHMQSYPLGACYPYCGPVQTLSFGNSVPPCQHIWVENVTVPYCARCGGAKSNTAFIFIHWIVGDRRIVDEFVKSIQEREITTMRCKVACSMKQPYEDGFYLSFYPVYTGSEENKEFFKYTPGGTVTFNVLNRAAADKFEVGKEYYLDFTPAV